MYAYTIYSAALTPVILAAFFWKRATAAAAVTSIVAGTFVTVFWDTGFVRTHLPQAIASRDAILPALLASLLCLVTGQLCYCAAHGRAAPAFFRGLMHPMRVADLHGFKR